MPQPLERLRIVAPIPAPVQRLKRGLLHRLPRRRLPAGALHDRVLAARHEHRRAPPVAITREREVTILARQALRDEADAVPGVEPGVQRSSPDGIAAGGMSSPRKPSARRCPDRC